MEEARNVFVITEEVKLKGSTGSIDRRIPELGVPLPAKVLLTDGEVSQLKSRAIPVYTEAEAEAKGVVVAGQQRGEVSKPIPSE